VLLVAGACGTVRQAPPTPPAAERTATRTERAAHLAFEAGQYDTAAGLFRSVLDNAYLRDDGPGIADAQYNLSAALLKTGDDGEALSLVRSAQDQLRRIGRPVPPEFTLLEATARYRLGEKEAARSAAARVLAGSPPPAAPVRARAHYLVGLVAADTGDGDTLRRAISALAGAEDPRLSADRETLSGRLAGLEGRWEEAARSHERAAALLREEAEYGEMAAALARAGAALDRAGRGADAAVRFLQAGRSAALQGNAPRARSWLTRASALGEAAGDEALVRDARALLTAVDAEAGGP
jgi:tetratricopeptide (TPR) repeat protein